MGVKPRAKRAMKQNGMELKANAAAITVSCCGHTTVSAKNLLQFGCVCVAAAAAESLRRRAALC